MTDTRYYEFEVTMRNGTKIIHKISDMDYFDACDEVKKLYSKAKYITPHFGVVSVHIP